MRRISANQLRYASWSLAISVVLIGLLVSPLLGSTSSVRVASAAPATTTTTSTTSVATTPAPTDCSGSQLKVLPGLVKHTGINLKKGDSYSTSATGRMWSNSDASHGGWGPDGHADPLGFGAANGLKGWISGQTGSTDLGSSGGGTASMDGELLLGEARTYQTNPDDAKNMSGWFCVTVTTASSTTTTSTSSTSSTSTSSSASSTTTAAGLAAYLDCGNSITVEVGTPANPAMSQICSIVYTQYNPQGTIHVTWQSMAGAPADGSGLIPGTGVVFPNGGVYSEEPYNFTGTPPTDSELIAACPQPGLSCPNGPALAGPVTIQVVINQDGGGTVRLQVTVNPVPLSGGLISVQSCPLDRNIGVFWNSFDAGANTANVDANFTAGINVNVTYARLELLDDNFNTIPSGPIWETSPDPLNPGDSGPTNQQLLLHFFQGNQELTNPFPQGGGFGVQANVPTSAAGITYRLTAQNSSQSYNGGSRGAFSLGQIYQVTAYLGNNLSSCSVQEFDAVVS